MTTRQSDYWWALDAKHVVTVLSGYRQSFRNARSNPVSTAWIRNIAAYYSPILGIDSWESALGYDGEQGEYVQMVIPQARSLVGEVVSMATKERLAFSAIARKDGEDVIQETRVGDALANQMVKTQYLETKKRDIAEIAGVLGMGFYYPRWRTDRGKVWTVGENDSMLMTGDLAMDVKTPLDITFQPNINRWEDQPWCEVRTLMNRWDLIAQYPELEQQIKSVPSPRQDLDSWTYGNGDYSLDDMIWVYDAYHVPSPSMPVGRMIFYADVNTVFEDMANLYGELPPEPMRPEQIIDHAYGYPFLSNLLPCQEMMDHNFSAAATNAAAFAIPTILNPSGNNLGIHSIGGMNWVDYTPIANIQNGGRPEALNLLGTPPEVMNLADRLKSHMMEIAKLNSAIRGEPPPGVTSGKAIATLTINALEFLSDFILSYRMVHERAVTKGVKYFRKFAKVPRPLELSTARGAAISREVTGDDLEPIEGVEIKSSNPMMQTISGRMEVADNLTKMGKVPNALTYFRIMEGAQPKEIYKGELAESDLIESENEAMLNGRPVQAIITDMHGQHIHEHKALIANNDVRQNSQIVAAVQNHILEHYDLRGQMPPGLEEMIISAMGVPQQQGAPQAPGGGGGPMPDQPEMERQTAGDDGVGRMQLQEGGE